MWWAQRSYCPVVKSREKQELKPNQAFINNHCVPELGAITKRELQVCFSIDPLSQISHTSHEAAAAVFHALSVKYLLSMSLAEKVFSYQLFIVREFKFCILHFGANMGWVLDMVANFSRMLASYYIVNPKMEISHFQSQTRFLML